MKHLARALLPLGLLCWTLTVAIAPASGAPSPPCELPTPTNRTQATIELKLKDRQGSINPAGTRITLRIPRQTWTSVSELDPSHGDSQEYVELGVSDKSAEYAVDIEWPSGHMQTLFEVEASDRLEVEEEVATFQTKKIKESSGTAISRRDPDVVWTHNDSGDKARLYAIRLDGKLLAEVDVDDAKSSDWEDLCSFRRDGKNYLAIGDIGDNNRRRRNAEIYVLEEPDLEKAKKGKLEVKPLACIKVNYPGGPVDSEALAYDAERQQFVVASKEKFRCVLYEVDASVLDEDRTLDAVPSHSLLLPMVTAADISSNADRMVFSTYGPGFVIRRSAGGKWKARGDEIEFLELPSRRQGESICFGSQDKRLILTSEFLPTPIFSIAAPQ